MKCKKYSLNYIITLHYSLEQLFRPTEGFNFTGSSQSPTWSGWNSFYTVYYTIYEIWHKLNKPHFNCCYKNWVHPALAADCLWYFVVCFKKLLVCSQEGVKIVFSLLFISDFVAVLCCLLHSVRVRTLLKKTYLISARYFCSKIKKYNALSAAVWHVVILQERRGTFLAPLSLFGQDNDRSVVN